ncbi:MAG: ATP-binding protein, partial [Acidimicrobiia bacterium]
MREPSPVTILFTDVEGSTDLRATRGDVAAHEILRAHEDLVRTCVTEHGGREVKALGDGFMIAFSSARRALECAVAIQQAVERQQWTTAGGGVRVRIGVNTGEVVEEQGDLYGQAVNAAARIAARAKAGEILVAEVTKQLVGTGPEFTFRDRGRLRLRGFPERWRLYGLVWAPDIESDAQAVSPGRTPFVGRAPERETLRRLLDQAGRGTGALVMIGGEPGVGKTRLAEELMAEAAGRNLQVFAGHCSEMEGAPPYVPFVEILETALARAPTPQAFVDDLGEEAAEVARLLPRLRRLFPDIPAPLELPPEQERRYLFNSIRDVMSRAARRRPLLLLLDDLQWADDPTILLVLHLAERLSELSVLVIGTYRDTDVGRPLARAFADLRRRPGTTWISLRRLSKDNVAELVRAMSGQMPPAPLVEVLHSEAEGNPFFLEEVYRHLVDQGRLFDDAGRFRPDLEISELDVPEGVRLVVDRRLERLGEGTVQILAAAAVIGRTFSFELLEVVGKVDSDTLLDAVEDAERSSLIASVADASGEDRFTFAHELVRQTLVSGLSGPRRRRLHARAADAEEHHYALNLDDHAAAIAHHLRQSGGEADRIFKYLVRAGRRALDGAAFEDALR